MKKTGLILLIVVAAFTLGLNVTSEQNFAYFDTDYILNKIPAYEQAEQKLDQYSEQYQTEVETLFKEVEQMYKDYQSEGVLLSDQMKRKREETIITKEKEAKELQKKYFGRDGELNTKREELIKPLQDEIFNAAKTLAEEGGFALIFDTSSGAAIIYSDDKYDKSDEILRKMGYQ